MRSMSIDTIYVVRYCGAAQRLAQDRSAGNHTTNDQTELNGVALLRRGISVRWFPGMMNWSPRRPQNWELYYGCA